MNRFHAHLIYDRQPFEGHSGVIQRNALKSWKLLHPEIEIILFGDDAGGAEIANELGFPHEPFVERNQLGAKRLDYIFRRAQGILRPEMTAFDIGANIDFLFFAGRVWWAPLDASRLLKPIRKLWSVFVKTSYGIRVRRFRSKQRRCGHRQIRSS